MMRRVADAVLQCRYLLPLLQINRQLAPFHHSCYGAIYFRWSDPPFLSTRHVIAEPSKAEVKERQAEREVVKERGKR